MELASLSIEELQRKIQQTLTYPDSSGRKRVLSRYINAARRKGWKVLTSDDLSPVNTGRSYDIAILDDDFVNSAPANSLK